MSGRLFHPSTVLHVALLLICLLAGAIGHQFDRAARERSPRGDAAGFPVDDAWIHQVYARSLATTGRLDYNPGVAEAGQSSLLFGALLVPVQWISAATGAPIGRTTRIEGVLVWIVLCLAAAALVRSLPIPGARFGSFATALLIALDPSIAYAAASGMEPLVASALLLTALTVAIRGRPGLAGAAAGFAILARPELVIAAPFVVWIAAKAPTPDGDADGDAAAAQEAVVREPAAREAVAPSAWLRRAARAALAALAVAAIWPVFCLIATGNPLPNTWYVKGHLESGGLDLVNGLRLLSGMVFRAPAFVGYAGFLFLFLGLLTLMTRVRAAIGIALVGTLVLTCIGTAATRSMPLPEAFFWERYLIPVLPLLHIITGLGLAATGSVLRDLLIKPGASMRALEAIESRANETSNDAGAQGSGREDDRGVAHPEHPKHPERPEHSERPEHPERPEHSKRQRDPAFVESDVESGVESGVESTGSQGLVIPDPLLAILLLALSIVPFAASPGALTARIDRFADDVACVDAMNVAAAEFVRDTLPPDHVVLAQDAGAIRYFGEHPVVDLIGLNDHQLIEAGRASEDIGPYLRAQEPRALLLLDPDPGAASFTPLADAFLMRSVRRFEVPRYTPFLEETKKAIVVVYRKD